MDTTLEENATMIVNNRLPLMDLQPELLLHILSFLDARELCLPISRGFYDMAQDPLLWKQYCLRKFPPCYHPPIKNVETASEPIQKDTKNWKEYCKYLNKEEWVQEECGSYIVVGRGGLEASNTLQTSPLNPTLAFRTIMLRRSLLGVGRHLYIFRLDVKGAIAGAGFGVVMDNPPSFEGDISQTGWSYFGHGISYGYSSGPIRANLGAPGMLQGDEVTLIIDFEELYIEFALNGRALLSKFVLPPSVRGREFFVAASLSRSKVTLVRWHHRYPPPLPSSQSSSLLPPAATTTVDGRGDTKSQEKGGICSGRRVLS